MPVVHAHLSRLRGRLHTTALSSYLPTVFIWFVFGVALHLHLRTWHLACHPSFVVYLAYLSALSVARTWLLVSHRGGSSPLLFALVYTYFRTSLGGFPLPFVSSFPSYSSLSFTFHWLYTSYILLLLSSSTSQFCLTGLSSFTRISRLSLMLASAFEAATCSFT